MLCGGFDG
jgi:hypothetical protein